MCAALACLLAGCGNSAGGAVSNAASKVGEVVSRVGEGMSEAASRVESALDGDSRLDSSDGAGIGMDSSGTVDSGTDGFIGSSDAESSGLLGSSSYLDGEASSSRGGGSSSDLS